MPPQRCGLTDVQATAAAARAIRQTLAESLGDDARAEHAEDSWRELRVFLVDKVKKERKGGDSRAAMTQYCDAFASQKKGFWGKLGGVFGPRDPEKPMMQMRKLDALEMSWKGGDAPFSMRECVALATMVLVGIEDSHTACPSSFTTTPALTEHRLTCGFRPASCPHEGCRLPMSIGRLTAHDRECSFKPLSCPNGCNAIAVRKDMPMHTESECIRKPVPCSYAMLGCSSILPACDLATHMEEAVNDHVWKLTSRVQDQRLKLLDLEKSIYDVNDTVLKYEKETHKAHMAEIAVAAKQAKQLKTEIKSVDSSHRSEVDLLRSKLFPKTSK